MPDPREIRVYTPDELKAIVAELRPLEAAAETFSAATGLSAAEWASVERRDIDKARRVVFVRGPRRRVPGVRFRSPRQRSQHSRTCPRGSTAATSSRRPGSAPVGTSPARLTSRTSGDVSGGPAIDSAGIAKPARIYDLRSTFISNALANSLTVFETARIAGRA